MASNLKYGAMMNREIKPAGHISTEINFIKNEMPPFCLLKPFIWQFICIFFLTGNLKAQSHFPERDGKSVKVNPAVPIKAYAIPLSDVVLLNSPFLHARSMDSAYLLLLNPNRLLNRFHKNAGLPIKDSVYGGWESEGLSGHTLGHYLSAASLLYSSTGNKAFKNRTDYIISELAKCQAARKTGYVGAIPNEDSIFAQVSRGQIKSSGFDLNGGWSPWYTVHKLMAGLVDAYLYTDNKQGLQIAKGMADWTWNTIHHLPDSTRLKMLNCEYGGMNDVLAIIYAITGEKKYLECSYLFYDEFVMGKLAQGIDPLPGKHSNTNVPKAIGSATQYEITGNKRDQTIARFFWESMTKHHTYVIGGNSNYEYCGEQDKLNDRLSDNTCETCNTYNMLKLTRHLFAWEPSAKLGDYYERALYNHILASQNPENGMTTYFVPLRMGTKKVFSDSFQTFTCCVGSGLENHAKYNEGIYYEGNDGSLFVNLFIPSVVNWKYKKVSITQKTNFPEENRTRFTITAQTPTSFILKIRRPGWAAGTPRLWLNDKEIKAKEEVTGFLSIDRTWKSGDKLEVAFEMKLYTESMPDNPNRIAFLYGPIVLAGKLGTQMPDPVFGTPVIMTSNKDFTTWMVKDDSAPLSFKWVGVGKPNDVILRPFYELYKEYYSVYWDYFTPEDWAQRQSAYEAEKKRLKEIDDRTIDNFRVGEMQPERDHKLVATERSYVSDAIGRMGREARSGHNFSFIMEIEPENRNTLLLTYIGDDKDRLFDILIDGELLTTVEWKGGQTGIFYDNLYPLPEKIIKGKKYITIKIDASKGKTAGRIFSARTLRQ
jgi:hypothetical protein